MKKRFSRSSFSRTSMNAKVLLQRFMSSNCAIEGNFVHPCMIQGKQSLVHASDLPERDNAFYQQLQQYADSNGYVLVADRRSKDSPDTGGRRKAWLMVMTLSLGMSSMAAADNNQSKSTSLGLFEPAAMEQVLDTPVAAPDINSDLQFDYHFEDTQQSQNIEAILLDKLVDSADTPDYVTADIQQMARYYSQYPQIVELIESIADKPWKLSFTEDTFAAEVRGSSFTVHSVNIKFDSRAAAQLRSHSACATNANACIASPADALLHEMIHAQIALLETERFIQMGGLSSVMYPYAHEHEVIQNERKLYRQMSKQDGVPRPQRSKHAGRLVASSCTVCIN